MKKTNRIFSLVLALSMIFSLSITASAKSPETDKTVDAVSAYAADLQAYIETTVDAQARASSANTDINSIVESFLTQYGSNYDEDALRSSENEVTINVDDKNTVIVSGTTVSVFSANIVEATPERIANGAIDVASTSANGAIDVASTSASGAIDVASTSASGITPIWSYTQAEYGILGNMLFSVTQEAQFIYTGSSCSVNYSNGYYTRGALSMWQVYNWTNSAQSSVYISWQNTWYKRVTSSGNFYYGFQYEGNPIIFGECFVSIFLGCSVNGQMDYGYHVN